MFLLLFASDSGGVRVLVGKEELTDQRTFNWLPDRPLGALATNGLDLRSSPGKKKKKATFAC